MLGGQFNELGVKVRIHARWLGAAQQKPGSVGQQFFGRFKNTRLLKLRQRRTDFVQLDGKSLAVGNGEIDANAVANRYDLPRKGIFLEMLLDLAAYLAPRGGDGDRVSS